MKNGWRKTDMTNKRNWENIQNDTFEKILLEARIELKMSEQSDNIARLGKSIDKRKKDLSKPKNSYMSFYEWKKYSIGDILRLYRTGINEELNEVLGRKKLKSDLLFVIIVKYNYLLLIGFGSLFILGLINPSLAGRNAIFVLTYLVLIYVYQRCVTPIFLNKLKMKLSILKVILKLKDTIKILEEDLEKMEKTNEG